MIVTFTACNAFVNTPTVSTDIAILTFVVLPVRLIFRPTICLYGFSVYTAYGNSLKTCVSPAAPVIFHAVCLFVRFVKTMGPFDGLQISNDWRILFDINDRQPCRMCSKSRKYFCYTCYTLNADLENKIPKIKVTHLNWL